MGRNLAEKYKQPLVPIHNTLKRLEAQGELVAFRDDTGDLRISMGVSSCSSRR